MARKNTAAAVVDPPEQKDEDSDEAAEKQLFGELEASSARKAQPQPDPSAVRSANLLNDARRSTAPAQKKASDGKLRRPTFMRADLAKLSQQNKARSRDIYEVPGSPEKDTQNSPFKLPTTVNKKPLKRVTKGKQPARAKGKGTVVRKESVVPEDKLTEVEVAAQVPNVDAVILSSGTDPVAAPSSPPPTLPTLENPTPQTSLPLRKSKRKQVTQASKEPLAKSPRRDVEVPTHARKSSPKVVIKVSRPRNLTPLTELSVPKPVSKKTSKEREDGASGHSAAQKPTTKTLPKTKTSDRPSSQDHTVRWRASPPLRAPPVSANGDKGVPLVSNKVPKKKDAQKRKDVTEGTSVEQVQPEEEQGSSHIQLEEEEQDSSHIQLEEDIQLEEEEQDSSHDLLEDESERNDDALDRVFKFLDSESRSGNCVTEEGTDIARFCQAAQDFNSNTDLTVDDMIQSANELNTKLTACGAEKSTEERKAIKIDAYTYLFRELARYLEVVYDWLRHKHDSVEESIPSMRIVTLVVNAIITFKDMLAHWKIPIADHDKGGRFVKDVDSKLIAPLRKVQKEYDLALDRLEEKANRRRIRDELRQRRREKEQETAQKIREEDIYKEKWSRWMDLHTSRLKMECDPNLRRRFFIDRSLFNALLKQSEERDANGEKFERLPVFRERDSPPPRRGPPVVDRSWPEGNVAALVDGLQEHCGPDVFKTIFQAYCFYGGELQQYTVPEITAQAAWIRSELLERYRENGWEIPSWIKQIPVLP